MIGSKLRRLLQYRWCKGAIIPPETRVDPARFPEDEFPVVCPKCSYLLTGLPEDCCPECGRKFDRGRLLVEQYLLMRLPLSSIAGYARLSWWICLLLSFGAPLSVPLLSPVLADHYSGLAYVRAILIIPILAWLLSLACLVVWWRGHWGHVRVRKEKNPLVFAALDWSEPLFARAQRLRWLGIAFIGIAGLIAFLLFSYDGRPNYIAAAIVLLVFALQIISLFKEFRSWGPQAAAKHAQSQADPEELNHGATESTEEESCA